MKNNALEQYDSVREDISTNIKKLENLLKKHEDSFKHNTPRTSWSYAGDLTYVNGLLLDAVEFLTH